VIGPSETPLLGNTHNTQRQNRCTPRVFEHAIPLRGIRFRTVPEILQAVDRSIRTINTTDAAKGVLRLPHRWQRVVHNAGDYIEGQYNFETCIYFVSVVNK